MTPTDEELEALLPAGIREKARRYFTPVSVAVRVATLLDRARARRVLDVGSGTGKFCVVAGKTAPELELVGVEQRTHLVEIARATAAHFGVDNATFLVGDATRMAIDDFDALYFFNPFAENAFEPDEHLDETVELTESRYFRDVLQFERSLARARVGTLVVTYHTFGGRFVDSFRLEHEERAGTDRVRVWRKTAAPATPGRYFLEGDDLVMSTDASSATET